MGQSSIEQEAASALQVMLQPPASQSPIEQAAPAPHSMWQLPPVQLEMWHSELPEQAMVHSPPGHSLMMQDESVQSW